MQAQLGQILEALRVGLGRYEPSLPEEMVEEFVLRFGRWLPSVVREPLAEGQVADICWGLSAIADQPIVPDRPPPDERVWLLVAAWRTESAVLRFLRFSRDPAYGDAHSRALAEVELTVLRAAQQQGASPAAAQAAIANLREAMVPLRGAPLWTPYLGGVEGQDLLSVIRQTLAQLPDIPPQRGGPDGWAKWAARVTRYDLQEWYAREVQRPWADTAEWRDLVSYVFDALSGEAAPLGPGPAPAAPAGVQAQIEQILAALRQGLGAHEPDMPREMRDEFVVRMGRWLPTVLAERLTEEQRGEVCQALERVPFVARTDRPPAPKDRLWLLEAVLSTQSAVSRFPTVWADREQARQRAEAVGRLRDKAEEIVGGAIWWSQAVVHDALVRLDGALAPITETVLWTIPVDERREGAFVSALQDWAGLVGPLEPDFRLARHADEFVRVTRDLVRRWVAEELGEWDPGSEESRAAVRLRAVHAQHAMLLSALSGGSDGAALGRSGETFREVRDVSLFLARPLFPGLSGASRPLAEHPLDEIPDRR